MAPRYQILFKRLYPFNDCLWPRTLIRRPLSHIPEPSSNQSAIVVLLPGLCESAPALVPVPVCGLYQAADQVSLQESNIATVQVACIYCSLIGDHFSWLVIQTTAIACDILVLVDVLSQPETSNAEEVLIAYRFGVRVEDVLASVEHVGRLDIRVDDGMLLHRDAGAHQVLEQQLLRVHRRCS